MVDVSVFFLFSCTSSLFKIHIYKINIFISVLRKCRIFEKHFFGELFSQQKTTAANNQSWNNNWSWKHRSVHGKCCTYCIFYLLFIDLELFSNWVCFTLQAAGEIEPYSIFIQTENGLYSTSKINLNHITWNTFDVNWGMNLQHFYNKYLFPSE